MPRAGPAGDSRPSIAQSSKWTLFGTVLSKPVQLATNVLLARVLGPAGFGVLGLANTTALAFGGVASLGLNDAATKFIAEHYRRDSARGAAIASLVFSTLVGFCGIFFLAAWLTRDLWGQRVFHGAVSDATIALCLGLGFLNVLLAFSNSAFSGLQDFREAMSLLLLQSFLLLCAGGTLGYFYGSTGAQWGYLLSALSCVAWAIVRLRRMDRRLVALPAPADLRELPRLLHFGAPSWLAAFLVQPLNLAALAYLAQQSGGVHDVGLFNSANGIKMLVAVIPGVVGTVIGPAIFEEAGTHGNPDAYRRLIDDSFAALGFLTVPLAIVLLFLSEPLFRIYGSAYEGSHMLFVPLAAGVAISLMGSPCQFALFAANRTWWLLWMTALKFALLILLAWWWIPPFMAAGLAWATAIADLAYTAIMVEVAVRSGAVPPGSSRQFYKFCGALCGVLGVACLLPDFALWLMAVPLALGVAYAMARRRPALVEWVVSASPRMLQPYVRSTLGAITRGAVVR